MISRAQQRRPAAPSDAPQSAPPAEPLSTYSGRKRPWLLALAATLVAGWIAFLAALAWHG